MAPQARVDERQVVHALKRIGVFGAAVFKEEFVGPLKLLMSDLGFSQVGERCSQSKPQPGFDERLLWEGPINEWQGGLQGLAECHVPAQASRLALGPRGGDDFGL